jgi:hypothetical protein
VDLKLIKTKPERIVRIDVMIMAFNVGRSALAPRVVELECGHRAITKSRKRMICPRCTEMLRRSIADGSEDYVSFRNGNALDRMSWKEDPCYRFNEPHDLSGNPLD